MSQADDEVIHRWQALPTTLELALSGLSESDLDLRAEARGWSIREFAHHIVEANLVASNIILAALATPGMVYDWSWVIPNLAWAERLGYGKLPIRPAIATLRALTQYYGELILASEGGLNSTVQLLDSPGATLYGKTVRALLEQEISHAAEHLEEVALMRRMLHL